MTKQSLFEIIHIETLRKEKEIVRESSKAFRESKEQRTIPFRLGEGLRWECDRTVQ